MQLVYKLVYNIVIYGYFIKQFQIFLLCFVIISKLISIEFEIKCEKVVNYFRM